MSKPELALWATEGDGRAYRHPFRLRDDKPLTSPSVTTVLKLVNKGEGLAQWAADQTLNYVASGGWVDFMNGIPDVAKGKARYRWKDSRDERAEVGTGVHETIEAEHTGTWNFPVLDAEQLEIMEQWRGFNQRYDIKPLRSEFTVWNFTHDYAGTVDGMWQITDLRTGEYLGVFFIDLKTSRNTWPEHHMQLAALLNAEVIMSKQPDGTWEEDLLPGEITVDDIGVVHLRADERLRDGSIKPGFADLIRFDKGLTDIRFKQFLGYRTLWGLEQEVKDFEKSKTRGAF